MIRLLHLLLFGLSLTSVLAVSKDPASLAENDSAYDTLVLQHRGRIKPFLSFAQELTASLTGRTSISLPDHGKVGARQLILSLWQKPAGWENEPIILVEDPALRKILNLAPTTRHFSPRLLVTQPRLAELTREAETARAAGPQAEIPSPRQRRANRLSPPTPLLFSCLGRCLSCHSTPHPIP